MLGRLFGRNRAANQPVNPAGNQANPTGQVRPNPIGNHGGLYPRWPLLTAMLYVPFICLGYGLLFYFQVVGCRLGALCQLGAVPGVIQGALIVLGFLFLWYVMVAMGTWLRIEDDTTVRSRFANWLRVISEFASVRWFIVCGGVATLLLLGWDALTFTLTVPSVAFGLIVLIVSACALFYRERPNTAAMTPQQLQEYNLTRATGFWFIIRTMPPLRWFIFPRAIQQPNAQNAQP